MRGDTGSVRLVAGIEVGGGDAATLGKGRLAKERMLDGDKKAKALFFLSRFVFSCADACRAAKRAPFSASKRHFRAPTNLCQFVPQL